MLKFYEKLDEVIRENEKNYYKILAFIVDEIGYISDETVKYIAEKLKIFDFTLEGIIEYYPKLSRARKMDYVEICIGKNCGVSMPQRKIEELEEKTGMKIVERVCLGRCGKQKVVKINGEIKNYDLEDELEKILLKSKKIRS